MSTVQQKMTQFTAEQQRLTHMTATELRIKLYEAGEREKSAHADTIRYRRALKEVAAVENTALEEFLLDAWHRPSADWDDELRQLFDRAGFPQYAGAFHTVLGRDLTPQEIRTNQVRELS